MVCWFSSSVKGLKALIRSLIFVRLEYPSGKSATSPGKIHGRHQTAVLGVQLLVSVDNRSMTSIEYGIFWMTVNLRNSGIKPDQYSCTLGLADKLHEIFPSKLFRYDIDLATSRYRRVGGRVALSEQSSHLFEDVREVQGLRCRTSLLRTHEDFVKVPIHPAISILKQQYEMIMNVLSDPRQSREYLSGSLAVQE